MKQTIPLYQVDAFTDQLLRGNPARRVQEMERTLSSRFTIVEVEHTAKPFAAMNRIIG